MSLVLGVWLILVQGIIMLVTVVKRFSDVWVMAVILIWAGAVGVRAADIDVVTDLTAQQNVGAGQSLEVTGAGSVSVSADDTGCIRGSSSGQGGNTVTLLSGAELTTSGDSSSNNNAYSSAIRVYGANSNANITGLAGGGTLSYGGYTNASNVVEVQAGSSISTSGRYANGVCVEKNNIVFVDGTIDTHNGYFSRGIKGLDNNVIIVGVNGSITTGGSDGEGIYTRDNCIVKVSGQIQTTDAYGIRAYEEGDITIESTGRVSTTGGYDIAIASLGSNGNITVRGSVSVSGSNASCVYNSKGGNVTNISGTLTATGADKSYAIESVAAWYTMYSNTFNILNGATLNGGIFNGVNDSVSTSYLTFGLADDGSGKANYAVADGATDITLNGDILVKRDVNGGTAGGNWDVFIAGGTTTFNGATNTLNNLFVGGECFDGSITVPDGNDGLGGAQTATLNTIVGATATLNVTQAITTSGAVTVGGGSTYNLSGTHTHSGTDITIDGVLELANGGKFENNATGGAQTLATLSVSAGTGTLAGSDALDTVTTANIDGTLSFEATADTTFNITNLSGILNQESVNNLTLASLNIAGGDTGTININAGTMTFNGINNSGTLNIAVATGAVAKVGAGIDMTAGNTKITLDFGADAGVGGVAALGSYAQIDGATNLTVSKDGNKVEQIFALNGIVGLTYEDVLDTNLLAGGSITLADGDILNTEDDVRIYTVKLDGNNVDILVQAAGSGANGAGANAAENKVTQGGGSAEAGKAAQDLVNNQASMPQQGQDYVSKLTVLPSSEMARAVAQTIGEGATTPSTQSSLLAITAATSSVENQMVNFRSGNIAQGLASSFGGSGATSALDNMADASELEVAYESGFTSGVDTTEYKKVTVWANGFGGFGEQGTVGSDIGYSFWNAGTMVGLDYAFARELRLGALFGYSYNKTDVNWNSGNSVDNALRVGAYASYNWNDFFVDLSPTMGIHLINSRRNIWDGSVAKGDRTGIDFNASGTVGYNFELPFGINFVPEYTLTYTMFYDPKYTETGAGAANVTYNSYTSNSLVQDLGLKFGKLFRVSDNLAFLPEVWGGWEYEFLDTGGERNTVTSAVLGAQSYTTEMNAMAQNRGYWGIGMTALLKDNVSIYGRYDQRVWHKGFNIGFLVGVKIDF